MVVASADITITAIAIVLFIDRTLFEKQKISEVTLPPHVVDKAI
jgi:hypothetical protein